jgi:hypothetical protein
VHEIGGLLSPFTFLFADKRFEISNPALIRDLESSIKLENFESKSRNLKYLTLTEIRHKFGIMRKCLKIRFLFILILYGFFVFDCKKETLYDLFPLKVGNEFYYKYDKEKMMADVNGTETWKVVSESSQGGSKKYLIERKLNAIYTYLFNQIVITDSISYLEVTEDESSLITSLFLSDSDLSFKRYQNVNQYVIEQPFAGTMVPTWKYVFAADSGLTSYHYHHPPNQITDINLHLDSLKMIP